MIVKKIFYLIIALGILSPKIIFAQKMNMPALNHIAVYVYDLQVSTNFYKKIIGLKTIPEPFNDGRHTWFTLGKAGQLHLISGADKNLKYNKNSHICFSVKDIDAFIENLNKNKIDFENWKGDSKSPTVRVDGVKQIYFKDPDGYWIEINNDH